MRRLFIKVVRDLLKDKFKVTMALLAIIFGTVFFGMMTFTYWIINREIVDVFQAINPSSANVMIDRVDDNLLNLTKDFEGFSEFEEKGYYEMRIQVGNQWKELHVHAIKDFSTMKINQIRSMEGSFAPGIGEVLIERDALGVASTAVGETITISLPDSSLYELKVVGVAHDITAHPASIENVIPIYVSYDMLEVLGLSGNRIDFIIKDNKYDRTSILAIGNDYMSLLEKNGYTVDNIDVLSVPGKSIHTWEYNTILAVLQVAAVLAFFLGCTVISSLMSTMISNQIRQIGILKSIGAKTGMIFKAYMSVIFALVLVSVVISIPIAYVLGVNFSKVLMILGNMIPGSTQIPIGVIAFYIVASLLVPITVAIIPIRRGVKATVKEALDSHGTIQEYSAASNKRNLENWICRIKIFSRPVVLSIRNAVRRKGRFYLNVAGIALGGILFIASVTAVISMNYTIEKDLETFVYDFQITTTNEVEDAQLDEVFSGISKIEKYENWGSANAKINYKDGQVGNLYNILAPTNNTKLYKPELLEGQWLSEEDTNEVVVGHQFFDFEEGYKLGDTVSFMVGGQKEDFVIVGTIEELGSPTIFMNKNYFDKIIPEDYKKNSIKLVTEGSEITGKEGLYQEIEEKLKDHNVMIFQSESMVDLLEVLQSHGMLIIVFFMLISIMILVVAGFGLTATMSVQVAERTREIGIMKAMGASKRQIRRIVTAESIFVSLISWVISVVIGILAGTLVSVVVGNMMVNTSLDVNYAKSYLPVLLWFVVTLWLGYYASRRASKRAARMSVKETLNFEQ